VAPSVPSATGYAVRGSNLGGGEILGKRPNGPWDPHSLTYNEYDISFRAYSDQAVTLTAQPYLGTMLKKE